MNNVGEPLVPDFDARKIIGYCNDCETAFDLDRLIEGDSDSYIDEMHGNCRLITETEYLCPCCKSTDWDEDYISNHLDAVGGEFL